MSLWGLATSLGVTWGRGHKPFFGFGSFQGLCCVFHPPCWLSVLGSKRMCMSPFFFFSRESFPVQLFIASPFSLAQGIFLFQNMGSKKPSTLCRLPIQLYCASTSAYSTSSRSSAPNSKPRQVSWFLSPGVLFLHKATGIEFLSCYEEKNHRLKYRKILS